LNALRANQIVFVYPEGEIYMATTLHETGTVVVGYFATGDAAHNAVHLLIEAGFTPSEIGAAFHIGSQTGDIESDSNQPDVGGSLRGELGTTQTTSHLHAGVSFGGAASTTNDVQVAALGGGAGSPFEGAGRPGPISGSSLAHTGLPSELKSTLPHDPTMPQSSQHRTPALNLGGTAATGVPPEAKHHEAKSGETWTEKLKHVFSSSDSKQHETYTGSLEAHTPKAPVTKESQNFGTGEGHLVLPNRYRYSQPAFEHSLSSHGLQSAHVHHLSQRIGHGGAIITVSAATRAGEAERVLEAAGGQVRFSAGDATETAYETNSSSNVELFGTIHSNYPGNRG
jgi:hypothetical protein